MRPIPAPRIGESHGLLRAIDERERLRLDEFVTEFSVDELFPPGLENALGRTRQFVSFARAAGLLKEDRGTVELTEIGRRYVKSGDPERPFEVSPGQAEWLRRQLREKHMTDSIYHGLAIGLSLLSSSPGARISTLDFGRVLGYLGRAGWDNENTLQIQGERHLALLRDLELIDDERRLTSVGTQAKAELTLPVHMSLVDLAAQQNPGGADAVREAGEAEWGAAAEAPAAAEPPVAAEAPAAPAPEAADDDDYADVGPGAWAAVPENEETPATAESAPGPAPPAAAHQPSAASAPVEPPQPGAASPQAASTPVEAPESAAPPQPSSGHGGAEAGPAGRPPVPPPDVWDVAAPDDPTRAHAAVRPPEADDSPDPGAQQPPSSEPPASPAAGPSPASAAPEPAPPAAAAPGSSSLAAPAEGGSVAEAGMTTGDPLPGGSAPDPADAATVISPPSRPPVPAVPAPPVRREPAFVAAGDLRAAAVGRGLRMDDGVYANVAAALAAGRHIVLTGPPGAGKTALALAVAKAAVDAGKAEGAMLVAGADETLDSHVIAAARRGKWLVVDEIDGRTLRDALGALAAFLGRLPVTLPGDAGELAAPDAWRVVATAATAPADVPAALLGCFAFVEVPDHQDLEAAIDEAAGGDATAAAVVRRLLPVRDLAPLGAGPFLAAARHAAERRATARADEAILARELHAAYLAPLLGDLDSAGQARVRELLAGA
jgi:MoxR-like ATPase